MSIYNIEHELYLKKRTRYKRLILITQLLIIFIIFGVWEILAKNNLINTFLFSSPSNIIKTTISLFKSNNLINHINITLIETIISVVVSFVLGILIASIMWWNKFISKVIDPYLTILNSLPKVALGPLIIIWVGASINSIIVMSLMISLFITIINLSNSFNNTNENYITLLKTLNASKKDIFFKVVLASNIPNIISTIKINVGMNLIGVVMGELLVSKEGLGYLIMYGSQVFNINLVITSIVILGLISSIMYYLINYLENSLIKKRFKY